MEKNNRTLLCVDDEKNILNALKRLLRKEPYRFLTANSGKEGLQLMAENEVHVVLSDQRMPEMSGTEFLKEVKANYPDTLRIILTGYTDVDSISEAINEGHLYKFFLKPWNDQNLKLEIRQAMEQYDLIEDNKRLHDQVFQQNQELKEVNENLEVIIQERTGTLEMQNKALQISHAILDDLPMPIIGVGADMMVVMANKASRQQWGRGQPISLGDSVGDHFEPDLEQQVDACLSQDEKICVTTRSKGGHSFEVELIPLSGRHQGHGVILTLSCRT